MRRGRFLLLEPFFGGSHREFAEGLIEHSRHAIELRTLPARFWKWRLRGAALYLAGTDNERLGRTRDAVVLAGRAIREGFRVLQSLGYPITPKQLRLYAWLPEPLLVPLAQRWLADPKMKIALEGHAAAAQDEIQLLCEEFLALAADSPVPIPTIRRLYQAFDPNTPRLPDGSRALALDWSSTIAGVAALVGVGVLMGGMSRRETERQNTTQRHRDAKAQRRDRSKVQS